MSERVNLQDQFLNNLRKEHAIVSMFLINGIKLVGRIESFDQYMVLLRGHDSALQAVFKHAISTVSPSRPGGEGPSGGPGPSGGSGGERRSPYGRSDRSAEPRPEGEYGDGPRPERRTPSIRYK